MSAPGTETKATEAKSEPRASWFGGAIGDEDELVGEVLSGSYQVVGVLGEGAMGRVYAAQHTRLAAKRFAVKVLHPELMRHKQVLVRFEREAQATSTLDHPNIVGVYDVDRTPDGRPYIVCEFLEGIELGQLLDDVGKLAPTAAIHVARQLCRALSVAHANGVLHRDMKPENVFVVGEQRDRPTVKVLDFGLARLEGVEGNSLTQAGTIMGTPSYMAPEQARGDRVDARADVYAVGAILYRSLTGKRPFERDDPPSTLAAVLTEEPPRPRSVEPSLSEAIELVIQRAMAREPAERFQTIDELEAELAALEADQDPVSHRTVLDVTPPPRRELSTLTSLPLASRSLLVVLFVLSFLWTLALIVSGATSAVELLMRRGPHAVLTGLELTLLVAAVCAILATPAVFVIRHLRAHVWNNTMRVSRTVTALRVVLFASMASYGAAALSVRLVDAVLARLLTIPIAAWPPSAAAWAGWPIVYVLVGTIAAGSAMLSQRLQERALSPLRRTLAGPVLTTVAALLASGVVYGGFVMRGDPVELAEVQPNEVPPVEAPLASSDAPAPAPQPSAPPPVEPSARASASELSRAISEGIPALEKLAKAHPEDVDVMKALVEASARDSKQQLLALEWTGQLLSRQPDLADWKTITMLVLQSAQGSEPASGKAFELMTSKMGAEGPDLLYDLMVATKGDSRQRAQTLLALPEVQKLATPALRIAFELREADGCEDQLPLLDRAASDGDARAVAILSAQVEGSKRGCGYKRMGPCPPKCSDKSRQDQIRAAITKIKERPG